MESKRSRGGSDYAKKSMGVYVQFQEKFQQISKIQNLKLQNNSKTNLEKISRNIPGNISRTTLGQFGMVTTGRPISTTLWLKNFPKFFRKKFPKKCLYIRVIFKVAKIQRFKGPFKGTFQVFFVLRYTKILKFCNLKNSCLGRRMYVYDIMIL